MVKKNHLAWFGSFKHRIFLASALLVKHLLSDLLIFIPILWDYKKKIIKVMKISIFADNYFSLLWVQEKRKAQEELSLQTISEIKNQHLGRGICSEKFNCLYCMDDIEPFQGVTLDCKCNMCLECFKNYGEIHCKNSQVMVPTSGVWYFKIWWGVPKLQGSSLSGTLM